MELLFSPLSRFKVCKQCTYSRKSSVAGVQVLTCGEFKTGGTVQHEGKEVKLCGCVVKLKVAAPWESCPAKKW